MSKKILYIEDNLLNLRLVRKILLRAGYEVLEALDATSGLQEAQVHQPDVILMDVNLPDMSGYEATEKLKASELANIPVVALTSDTTEITRQRCLESGCTAYVNKPISIANLLRTVQQVASTMPV